MFRADQFHIKPEVAKAKHWGPVSIRQAKARAAMTAQLMAEMANKRSASRPSLLKSVRG